MTAVAATRLVGKRECQKQKKRLKGLETAGAGVLHVVVYLFWAIAIRDMHDRAVRDSGGLNLEFADVISGMSISDCESGMLCLRYFFDILMSDSCKIEVSINWMQPCGS